jgi:hypothetical protein
MRAWHIYIASFRAAYNEDMADAQPSYRPACDEEMVHILKVPRSRAPRNYKDFCAIRYEVI